MSSLPVPLGRWSDPVRFDLQRSFRLLLTGRNDPTASLDAVCFAKACWTPTGPCTVRFYRDRAEGVGPGAHWWAEHASATFQLHEAPQVRPEHPLLAERSHQLQGLRLVRVPWLSDLAASLVLQQRVTFAEAAGAYRRLIEDHGQLAPCGVLRLPLQREQWLRLGTARVQSYNVDLKRATTLMRVADHSRKIDKLYHGTFEQARALLAKIPGIGPWTREGLLGYGLGDPDAVQTGDVWLPHTVSFALTGHRWSSDEKMLELLEPYAGYRFLVIRWLLAF